MYRLRDLESPEPSSSATPITPAATSAQRRNNSTLPRQTKPLQSATAQRDRQSTVVAKQRSAPDRKRETAEEAKLREAVMSEVLDIKPSESWNDIAGLDGAKQVTADGTEHTVAKKVIWSDLPKHKQCSYRMQKLHSVCSM